MNALQALELKEDTPERRAKRMKEYKALEKEFLEQEKLKSNTTHTSSGSGGRVGTAMEVEEADRSKGKAVSAVVKRKHEIEKQKEVARQMEASRKTEEKKQKEAANRVTKRRLQESKIGGFDSALKHLFDNYSIERVKETLSLLLKICTRILKNQDEPKFRRIKLSNKLIQRALVRPLGAMILARELGFVEDDECIEMKLVEEPKIRSLLKKIEQLIRSFPNFATGVPNFYLLDPLDVVQQKFQVYYLVQKQREHHQKQFFSELLNFVEFWPPF